MFHVNENIDPFKVMDLLGVTDQLYCLDLIQSARNEVNYIRHLESISKAKGGK